MGYVPKFIHLDHFIDVIYPFGVHWEHSYIQQSAKALKKNSCDDYRKWKGICSRFEYVVCCPKPKEYE